MMKFNHVANFNNFNFRELLCVWGGGGGVMEVIYTLYSQIFSLLNLACSLFAMEVWYYGLKYFELLKIKNANSNAAAAAFKDMQNAQNFLPFTLSLPTTRMVYPLCPSVTHEKLFDLMDLDSGTWKPKLPGT